MPPISRIEVRVVAPESARLTWANLPPQYQTQILVRVFDASGADGVGATMAYSGVDFDKSILETLRVTAPRLIGKESLVAEARWRQLQDYSLPIPPGALAVLDIAMWDLCARTVGRPLYRLLGGERDRIRAYASTPQLDDDAAYVDLVASLREQGYRAVKFHSWNIPDRDLSMLRAVHREHGQGDLLLMHDAEMMYDRRSALRVGKALEEMDFHWFEAPLQDFDLDGYRELRTRVGVPIIPQGCRITDLARFADAAASGAWDAARFDVALQGITDARRMVHAAHAHGLAVEPQSWGYTLVQAANLHLSLALEEDNLFELPIPTEAYEFGAINPFRIDAAGWVHAPTGAGLGVDLDWPEIERATIASFVAT
jgi:L-alanine-DL-glutamate epimerase-like enolase superfamily enzyme